MRRGWETSARLGAPPPAQAVPPLPETAHRVSDVISPMDPNPANIASIRLDVMSEDEMTVTIATRDDPAPIVAPIGLDGVARLTPGEFGLPVAARGSWEDERTFVFDLDTVANNHSYTMRVRFDGDAIPADIEDHENGAVIPLTGTAMPPGASPAASPPP